MTNQIVKPRVTGTASLAVKSENLIKLFLAIGLLLLGMLTVANLRNEVTSVNNEPAKSLSALPQDGRAYFTEPYWDMAAAAMEAKAAGAPKSLSALPDDGRAFYTEPYWNANK